MNKIIIVGHPHSGHEEVQRLLTECGMAPALPSRRENLTPAQITQTLVQAHGATSLELLQSADQLQQIKVAPVWQGMVLDLVLANLAQPLWGWADTEAVYLLDYWKEQDPQVVFVLVYDAPETVLTRVPLGQAAAPQEELQRRIDAWVAYNSALLHFHLRSAGRSVLVHAGQVQASVKSSLHHITAHINAPLQLPPRLLITSTAESQAPQNLQAHAEIVEELTAKLNTMQGKQFKKARQRLRAELQALQSAASAATEGVLAALHSSVAAPASDLPLCPAPNVFEQGHLDADALANLLAQQLLQTHPKSRQLYEELQASATLAHGTDAQLTTTLPALQSESSLAPHQAWQALVAQRLHLQDQVRRTKSQAAHIKDLQQQVEQASHLAQEKVLLLEDLRAEHMQTQALALQRQALLEQQAAALQAQTVESQRQHAALTQQQKQTAETEGQLLLNQLHQVQEELERYYLEGKKHQQEIDKLKKVEALAAEHQKQLEHASAAKFDLEKTLTAQKQQSDQLKKQLDEKARTAAELEQKLKSALSQKVVSEEAQKENELLLSQLHQVQEELERYYLENQRLKTKPSVPPKTAQAPAPYGAAERVKRQLSYRLGNKMIEESRSLGGWLGMPFALAGVARQYKRERPQREAMKQIPIEKYRDAHQAQRVKQHLSYRLGVELVKHGKNPLRWPVLPFALRKARQEWLSQQAH